MNLDLASLVGGRVSSRARDLVVARPQVVVVRGGTEWLRRGAVAATVARARAVIAVPEGAAAALPWWERRFHRYVLPTQAAARSWLGVGVALGRLVVVPAGPGQAEAWAAVLTESASMG